MSVLLSLVASSIVAASPAPAIQADPVAQGLANKADACIRSNARSVAPLAQSLNDAVNFLVEGLCGLDVYHYETYLRNVRLLAEWRAAAPKPGAPAADNGPPGSYQRERADEAAASVAQLPKVVVDPETGEMSTPPGFKPPDDLAASRVLLQTIGSIQHSRFRTIAAQAVLAARQDVYKH